MRSQIEAFVSEHWQIPAEQLRVSVRSILGGLESAVGRARLRATQPHRAFPHRMIVKEMRGRAAREADVYEMLWRDLEHPPAARVFGCSSADDARYLFLEDVQSPNDWPWRDTAVSAAVCRALARLHDSTTLPSKVEFWDYEAELASSASETLAVAAASRTGNGTRVWRAYRELKRIVDALPKFRERLLSAGIALIHGDVHPGNVIIRPNDTDLAVTLIDWSRTRVGSPLEDVASWLHSLGCWEPEARRRHDTLLRAYLESRTSPTQITADLRKHYWFASASNGLAGAIRYHIAVLSDPASAEGMRSNSQQALHAWERVVRRAAALVPANLPPRTSPPRSARRSPKSPRSS